MPRARRLLRRCGARALAAHRSAPARGGVAALVAPGGPAGARMSRLQARRPLCAFPNARDQDGVQAGDSTAALASLRLARRLRGAAQMHKSSHLREASALQQPHGEPGARRNHAMRAQPPSAAPPRTRSGSRAACAALLRCIKTLTCASPARCSSLTARLAPDVIMPRRAAAQRTAALASLRLARRLRGAAQMHKSSHLREASALQQPHGEPGARRNHAMRAQPPSAAPP